jgi:hypothetical protein
MNDMQREVTGFKHHLDRLAEQCWQQPKTAGRGTHVSALVRARMALCAFEFDGLWIECEWDAVCNQAADVALDASAWLMRQDAGWRAVLACAEAVEVQA